MGDKNVSKQFDEEDFRRFTKAVLNDLQALEKMLAGDLFENGARRIGAEQEMFLVDSALRPAPLSTEIIEAANDKRLTTEIGRFNLEANLTPLEFTGDCLRRMENELHDVLNVVRSTARKLNADVVLAGILPTIQLSDLTEENLTPNPRYEEMNRVLTKMHGGERLIQIKGLDELQLQREDIFLEFCNTSLQIHLQVDARDFARHYNWAQAATAPVLAAAVNSPLLLGHRLWHETRLALFQHAADTRSAAHQARSQPSRVNFGEAWVKNSILEVFHEDVARFRIIFTQSVEEDSLELLGAGNVPQLLAWQLHNGTVWRWNRACYGVADEKASLRVEARFLPAGPTVTDEMANAAFFLGLMVALPEEFGDVSKLMLFDNAKNNFFSAARYGLNSQLTWIDGKSHSAPMLILEKLLPLAHQGLNAAAINSEDVERLLGILEERVRREKTGAQWMLDSLGAMDERVKPSVKLHSLTAAMKAHQEQNEPLHTWQLAEIPKQTDWIDNYRTVEQFMSTDLFTVRSEDLVDLAASLMNWRHVQHVPVEDDEGHLIGLVSYRDLLKIIANPLKADGSEFIVREVMVTDPVTITPQTPTLEALQLMRERSIGCLPVVEDKLLVGMLTTHDFLNVSAKLFEDQLNNFERE